MRRKFAQRSPRCDSSVAPRARCARLFTFQKSCVLDLFDFEGRYVPTREGIGIQGNHRIAYEFVVRQLRQIELTQTDTPQVWAYEAEPKELDLLASALLSDHELSLSEYVTVELMVPEKFLVRTAYGAWCELYFSCLETREISDDGSWLAVDPIQENHETVQAILPHILRSWVVATKPLRLKHTRSQPPASGNSCSYSGFLLFPCQILVFLENLDDRRSFKVPGCIALEFIQFRHNAEHDAPSEPHRP